MFQKLSKYFRPLPPYRHRISRRSCSDASLLRSKHKRPRRALFYVPGSDQRKLNKVFSLALDTVAFDFEDGVAYNKKQEARENVVRLLTERDFGSTERVVRINHPDSEFYSDDLDAIKSVLDRVDAIFIPKVETASQIEHIGGFLDKHSRVENFDTKIIAGIESSNGLLNLREICNSSPRLDALVFGSEDFSSCVGITRTSDGQEFLYARSKIATYAAAYNLAAIDMVCIQYKDQEQLIKECIQGFSMGFVGKQAIHPNQIQIIYQYFKPTDRDINFARRILDENQKNQSKGTGAWEIDGKMIDRPLVIWAQKILQKANLESK
eukprot:TRINITY_DN6449_c0_g1_i2.p1 TRINITY_DN6449_c0_g1~~TRINITY_DN6449_c0_g1_i2.p1  ORF type:complete len:323 (-),score=54.91 TRINITY_DN6449_c0_g1_i2:144-1112(-)